MKISDIRVTIAKGLADDKIKAFVSFAIDDAFAVNDIKIINGKNGLFVSMPSRVLSNGSRRDIFHPINNDARMLIINEVLKAYDEALKAQEN